MSKTPMFKRRTGVRSPAATSDHLLRQAIYKLLAVKDSDIRLLTLEQCRDAVDKSLHAGGAFSATIPLVTLFYGGFIDVDVADPTRPGQDLFVLSKGHAVAALASIYAELGYFDRSVLRNSRSYASILNGHPGPDSSGHSDRDGPDGAGACRSRRDLRLPGRVSPRFDCYVLCGDGEMQEGPIWEAVMFAGQKHLDNLCVMVDRNNGQLDLANRMIFPMPDLETVFEAFNWEVRERRCHAVRRRLCRARAVPFRSAQRQADGDHLPRHERAWRALRFPEQAQSHRARSTARAGDGAAGRTAARSRQTSSSRFSRRLRGLPRRRAASGNADRIRRPDAPGRPANASGALSLSQVIGPVVTIARAARETSASSTTRRSCRGSIASRNTPRATSSRGDEGVRARSARGVDRRRPRDDERPRSRRRRRGSAARAERRRGRGQHDGHRRGVRRARAAIPGSARSARSTTGRCCAASRSGHQERHWKRSPRKTAG